MEHHESALSGRNTPTAQTRRNTLCQLRPYKQNSLENVCVWNMLNEEFMLKTKTWIKPWDEGALAPVIIGNLNVQLTVDVCEWLVWI